MQVSRQRQHLLGWLKTKRTNNLPVETLVVSANSSTIIRAANKDINRKVIRKDRILLKIEEINYRYSEAVLSTRAMKRLSNLLLEGHIPNIPKPLENYRIPITALQTGLFCHKCSAFTMERKSKKWICRTCLDMSLDAHISALYDYLYLVKPTITNREFRNFVQLQSPSSAKKLLLSLKLNHSGHTRDRVYLLNSLLEG